MIAGDVLVVFHHLVDDTVRSKFDDTVRYGLDEFVVVRSEKNITLIKLQVVVECLDRFQVKVVSWSIKYKRICISGYIRAFVRPCNTFPSCHGYQSDVPCRLCSYDAYRLQSLGR